MLPAPLGQDELLEAGRWLMLGSAGAMGALLLVSALVYLCLCLLSSRDWDGLERRWRARRD